MRSYYPTGFYHLPAEITLSLCAYFIASFLAIRFADGLMGIAAFISLLCFTFYSYTRFGGFSQTTFTFPLIVIASGLYYFMSNVTGKAATIYYASALTALKVLCLLAIYACGNFYFVNELIVQRFHLVTPAFVKWFCWVWTMAIPIIYLVAGLRNKNISMARVAAILIPVSIITFRYYHSILSAEVAITVAGIILIVISYWLIHYLRSAKYGYTFEVQIPQSDLRNLEGFIIGEAFGNKTHQQQDTKFGGGSFGGAGAGDSY